MRVKGHMNLFEGIGIFIIDMHSMGLLHIWVIPFTCVIKIIMLLVQYSCLTYNFIVNLLLVKIPDVAWLGIALALERMTTSWSNGIST